MKKKLTFKIVGFLILWTHSSYSKSVNDTLATPRNLMFYMNHISIGINSNYYFLSEQRLVRSINAEKKESALSYGFNVNYTLNFKNPKSAMDINWKISNLMVFNTFGRSSPSLLGTHSLFSIGYTRRFLVNSRAPMFATAGVNFTRFYSQVSESEPLFGSKYSNSNNPNFYSTSVKIDPTPIAPALNFTIGNYFCLSNKNMIKVSINMNYGGDLLSIKYTYFEDQQQQNNYWGGNFYSRAGTSYDYLKNTSIGLSVEYVFSGYKKISKLIK